MIAEPKIIFADTENQFERYMEEWYSNKEIATSLLVESQKYFEQNDELSGCSYQQKAGETGIKATEALLKAIKIKGPNNGLDNIEAGIEKWKEVRDAC